MYNFEELFLILGKDEYFTKEQIDYIVLKLNDKNLYSLYLQQVMSNDIKTLNKNKLNK